MHAPIVKIRTLAALGCRNLFRVLLYRLTLRMGIGRIKRRVDVPLPTGAFFAAPAVQMCDLVPSEEWWIVGILFGWWKLPVSENPPHWHANPIEGKECAEPSLPWWRLPDFSPSTGDIKGVWESSRFDWVLFLALRGIAGHQEAIDRMNVWLADWWRQNPPFQGNNWKCGQEASIRVMHLALAAMLLEQHKSPSEALVSSLRLHLQRISPTVGYALAQDNNHGTSEAAALFIGGTWLSAISPDAAAKGWERLGRRLLENRAGRLIEADGTFSQYSVNYHRLMLDTMSTVEIWRRSLNLQPFSPLFHERCRAATEWLRTFVDEGGGEAPNLGANDGASLLPAISPDYRDFRPSVQLASVLFSGARAYTETCERLRHFLSLLGIREPALILPDPASRLYDQGGIAFMRRGKARLFLRYPRFRFRPAHADALHIDLWVAEQNLLRDGGTYSYNTDPFWMSYFPGVTAHNTIQFDSRDQMPRVGRFLYGAWLRTFYCSDITELPDSLFFETAYRDPWGATHARQVNLGDGWLTVTDRVEGFRTKAVLRWRLKPGKWEVEPRTVSFDGIRLAIHGDVPIIRFEIVEGWESRYYWKKEPIPVLEIEVEKPGIVVTEMSWQT